MRVAQGLYESGAITYMRTDGVDMAAEAISDARRAITERYDSGYVPDRPRQYQSKIKNAQEAHEAIRPTEFSRRPSGSDDAARLYELVYNRALASQMASAKLERTTVELRDGAGRVTLRATGQVVLFPGFMALYDEGRDDADAEDGGRMPLLRSGDAPAKTGVEATQHFTQPPPRFTEASLVKRLEELGIGRPSTYASILQTLKDRDYVRLEKNRFIPEESGRLVTPSSSASSNATSASTIPRSSRRNSTTFPAGGSTGSSCSTPSGATSSPRRARSPSRNPPTSPPRSTIFCRPGCFPTRTTAATRGCARCARKGGYRFAEASSAHLLRAPIIPTANTPVRSEPLGVSRPKRLRNSAMGSR